jgi:hypothetical protein
MKANLTLDQLKAMKAALQAFLNEGKEPFDGLPAELATETAANPE